MATVNKNFIVKNGLDVGGDINNDGDLSTTGKLKYNFPNGKIVVFQVSEPVNTGETTFILNPDSTNVTYDLTSEANGWSRGEIRLSGDDGSQANVNIYGTGSTTVSSNSAGVYINSSYVDTNYDLVLPGSGVLRLSDSNNANDDVTFVGTGSTSVSSNTTHIVINSTDSDTTYDLLSPGSGVLRLSDSNNANDEITFVGSDGVSITSNATHFDIAASYVDTATFTNGTLTIGSSSTADVTVSLDGRYLQSVSIDDLTDARYVGQSLYLGDSAGINDDGTTNNNVGVGRNALRSLTSGSGNVAVGAGAGYNITSQTNNVLVGLDAGLSSSGTSSVIIGRQAGYSAKGTNNVLVGNGAGSGATSTYGNIGIGAYAGSHYQSFGQNITTSNKSIFIGGYAMANAATSNNELVIGWEAIGNGDNTVTIGNSNHTGTYLSGVVNAPSIVTGSIDSTSISANGDLTITGSIKGPETLIIDPSPYANTAGTVVIEGDLQVKGTTTTVNSTEVTIDDKNIVLANGSINKAAADGGGITIDLGTDGTASLQYKQARDSFSFDKSLEINEAWQVSTWEHTVSANTVHAGDLLLAPSTDGAFEATVVLENSTGRQVMKWIIAGTTADIAWTEYSRVTIGTAPTIDMGNVYPVFASGALYLGSDGSIQTNTTAKVKIWRTL